MLDDYVLTNITSKIRQLDGVNPQWREHFDPEFVGAIQRAMSDYAALANMKAETAKQATEINDALLYLAMSIYTSIERVVERKKLYA
jgi:hypothetical protein